MILNDAKGFWWLTLSVVFGLTLPILIQDAMFQDAVLYSAVANNMSVGFGNFWFPQYSTLNLEGIPSFHEQPPLFFGMMAVLYKIFGSSLYVERIFTAIMMVLHILLIKALWKHSFGLSSKYNRLSWLPVFFWILFPVCFWSFRNNMIENAMGVFILLSVLFSLRALEKRNPWPGFFISGLFIFLATFCKGVPGLFPIAVPFLYGLVFPSLSFRRSILYSAFLALIPAILYGIILCFPGPRESLSIYFFERLLGRVDTMPTTMYRLYTLERLALELIPHILLIAPVLWAFRKSFSSKYTEVSREFIFYGLLGLAGTLPLMLTMVQKGWYMVPAFPYLALALAALVAPFLSDWFEKITPAVARILKASFSLLFAGVLVFTAMQHGKISREHETLSDVYKIGKIVPAFSTITVPETQYDEYNFILQGFLVRYFHISISPFEKYDYFLTLKNEKIRIPADYTPVDIGLVKYNLYKR